MAPSVTYVKTTAENAVTFSVCSLVRDQRRYDVLLKSFEKLGFTPENSEFLAADNRDGNIFDGYTWQRALLPRCSGKYVIFCHEDVELLNEGYAELLARLNELDTLDPNWLLAGLAGGVYRPRIAKRRQWLMNLVNKNGKRLSFGQLPGRAETLDEFFIVMRRDRPVLNSYDLSGFHYYGLDICLQAELLGGSAYVIDFLTCHHGDGVMGPSFDICRAAFADKYRKYFPGRMLHSTVGMLTLGDDRKIG